MTVETFTNLKTFFLDYASSIDKYNKSFKISFRK
jgi:hypothetical protein